MPNDVQPDQTAGSSLPPASLRPAGWVRIEQRISRTLRSSSSPVDRAELLVSILQLFTVTGATHAAARRDQIAADTDQHEVEALLQAAREHLQGAWSREFEGTLPETADPAAV